MALGRVGRSRQLRKNIDATLRADAKAKSLVSGMGSLSMPPGAGGMFYVAAPGRDLPTAE